MSSLFAPPSTHALPQPVFLATAEQMMREAIDIAHGTPAADVPVGAVVFNAAGEIIGVGTNRRETDGDPTAHAEMIAIRQAATQHGDGWRLTDCTIVVTLEPCAMCAGAVMGARIGRIVFGAFEPKTGACGSVYDLVRDGKQLHSPEVMGGVLEEECSVMLGEFFRTLR